MKVKIPTASISMQRNQINRNLNFLNALLFKAVYCFKKSRSFFFLENLFGQCRRFFWPLSRNFSIVCRIK